jgi:hypothetical protein
MQYLQKKFIVTAQGFFKRKVHRAFAGNRRVTFMI